MHHHHLSSPLLHGLKLRDEATVCYESSETANASVCGSYASLASYHSFVRPFSSVYSILLLHATGVEAWMGTGLAGQHRGCEERLLESLPPRGAFEKATACLANHAVQAYYLGDPVEALS